QVGLRAAEGEAIAQAADREAVGAAVEGEGAAADRSADDPARLEERDADKALVCSGRRQDGRRNNCSERDEDRAKQRHESPPVVHGTLPGAQSTGLLPLDPEGMCQATAK